MPVINETDSKLKKNSLKRLIDYYTHRWVGDMKTSSMKSASLILVLFKEEPL